MKPARDSAPGGLRRIQGRCTRLFHRNQEISRRDAEETESRGGPHRSSSAAHLFALRLCVMFFSGLSAIKDAENGSTFSESCFFSFPPAVTLLRG